MKCPEEFINTIQTGDCLKLLDKLPNKCINVVVTSPPYNLKNSTGNGLSESTHCGKWKDAALRMGYDNYDDNMPYELYVGWQRQVLTELMRVIKDDGAIFYNHKWRVQNGLLQDRWDIIRGFPVRQIIIWKRKGGINFNKSYFLPTYEVIYLIAKPNFVLSPKANAFGDVWDIKQEMNNEHPAAFPIELAYRCVESSPGDIVLDPFVGSGTTALAALQLDKKYIGFDISAEYCEMAKKRIKAEEDFNKRLDNNAI